MSFHVAGAFETTMVLPFRAGGRGLLMDMNVFCTGALGLKGS